MAYIAKIDDVLISSHKTYEAALKSLMEYEGFSKKQIQDAIRNGEDITNTDPSYQIIETVR